MLGHVGQSLRDDEVGCPLGRRRKPFAGGEVAGDDRGHGPPPGDRLDRGDETPVHEDRRRDPAHEVADLRQGLARLFLALEDELLGRRGIVVDPLAGQSQVDGQHDQALLGAIVEVTLDPVQLARFDVQDR